MAAGYSKKQKALILKALTDPKFRKALAADPAAALGAKKMTPEKKKEVTLLLAVVKGIDAQIAALADELLCANGGPCGIA
jgi:hypothetical protein